MKKILLMVIAVLMAGQAFAQEEACTDEKKAGNEAYKAKNYAEAYRNWDIYLEANNYANVAYCYNTANVALKAKKYQEAVAYYERAINGKYKIASSYAGMADAYRDMGNVEKYVATLEAGMQAVPNNEELEKKYAVHFIQAGQAAQKDGKTKEAESNYAKLCSMTNKGYQSQGYLLLGRLYFANGAKLQEDASQHPTNTAEYAAGKEKALEAYDQALNAALQARTADANNADAAALQKQASDAMAALQ